MTDEPQSAQRREFLARTLKAGASIAVAVGLAAAMLDRKGPGTGNGEQVKLGDYSVPHAGPKMSIVRGSDRQQTVTKAIELLGGIGTFVEKGDIVAIKPNVAFSTPPALGATTHPAIVEQVIKLCLQAGAAEVIVADNPINAPASCFKISRIGQATRKAGAKLVLPNPGQFKRTTLTGGKLIRDWPIFFEPFAKANKLIGIAPVKHHHRSGASMTMKNFYGLLGGKRNIFHQDIHTIITELALMVKPTLVILDGTTVMMTNGPTGGSISDLRTADTVIASTDMVAADSFGATLLGLKIYDLPYLKKAQAAGAGTCDYHSLNPLDAKVN